VIDIGSRQAYACARVRGWAAALAIPCAQAQTLSVVHNFTAEATGEIPVNGFTMSATGTLYGTAQFPAVVPVTALCSRLVTKATKRCCTASPAGRTGQLQTGRDRGPERALSSERPRLEHFGAGNGVQGEENEGDRVVQLRRGHGRRGSPGRAGHGCRGESLRTTSVGGSAGNGTVFELVAPKVKSGRWTETVLYSFGTGTDGATPIGGVNLDAAGNLYGTTSLGGTYGYGTVFRLTPGSGWTENFFTISTTRRMGPIPTQT